MIDGQRVLGLIPARGGSKSVPGKNIFPVGGKPLIAWTIEAALKSRYIDRLVLSSDNDAIISVAKAYGCEAPFKRESHLAADDTPTVDVVLNALQQCLGYDYVVLLQSTSPLRITEDIDTALECCVQRAAPACVSICEAEQSPYWMFTLGESGLLAPLLCGDIPTRRQDLPPVYVLNGAVYVARVDWLHDKKTFITSQTCAYEMPIQRSLDIDTEVDLHFAEFRLGR